MSRKKDKQLDYHGGREASERFRNAMQKIVSVPKERLAQLEKQNGQKGRKRASRDGLSS
jgi:hypothetical protein